MLVAKSRKCLDQKGIVGEEHLDIAREPSKRVEVEVILVAVREIEQIKLG